MLPISYENQLELHNKHEICNSATCGLHVPCDTSLAENPRKHTSNTGSGRSEQKGEDQSASITQSGNVFMGSATAGNNILRGNMYDNATNIKNINLHQQRSTFAGVANAVTGDAKDGSVYRENPSGAPSNVTQDGHEFRTDIRAQQGDIFQGNSYMHQGNPGDVFQGGHLFSVENTAQADGNVIQGNWIGPGKPDYSMF
jgi:hypothetical protein